ncbi:hypothetical protein Tco_0651061, partial [Tanacetum coccineum]
MKVLCHNKLIIYKAYSVLLKDSLIKENIKLQLIFPTRRVNSVSRVKRFNTAIPKQRLIQLMAVHKLGLETKHKELDHGFPNQIVNQRPYQDMIMLKGTRSIQLASPKQTALGKDFSNPLMADSLPKSIHFCDSLQSDEDSFELIELMILCTNFLNMVRDLENLKTTYLIMKKVWVRMHPNKGGLMMQMQRLPSLIRLQMMLETRTTRFQAAIRSEEVFGYILLMIKKLTQKKLDVNKGLQPQSSCSWKIAARIKFVGDTNFASDIPTDGPATVEMVNATKDNFDEDDLDIKMEGDNKTQKVYENIPAK